MRRLVTLAAVACLSIVGQALSLRRAPGPPPLGRPERPPQATGLPHNGSLRALGDAWPRAFFFRGAGGQAANPKLSYEEWERTFRASRYRGQGPRGGGAGPLGPISRSSHASKRRIPRSRAAALQRHARDPSDQRGKFFDGHWLYYNGARCSNRCRRMGAKEIAGERLAAVPNRHGRYRTGPRTWPCARWPRTASRTGTAASRWSWSRWTRPARRSASAGQYGTRPRAFAAGRAWPPRMSTRARGKKSHLLWAYNYSVDSPRDSRGRSCADALIEDLGELFEGKLASFDGMEFDVLKHAGPAGTGGRGYRQRR